MVSFTLNDKRVSVDAQPTTPLLWVIRDHVGLTGTKYGCGAGLCGARSEEHRLNSSHMSESRMPSSA